MTGAAGRSWTRSAGAVLRTASVIWLLASLIVVTLAPSALKSGSAALSAPPGAASHEALTGDPAAPPVLKPRGSADALGMPAPREQGNTCPGPNRDTPGVPAAAVPPTDMLIQRGRRGTVADRLPTSASSPAFAARAPPQQV